MKRATIALIAALVTAMLSLTVSAQTLRLPQDPRNQAPTVGTGGPGGGPTGLFTVYDGDTIRRGGVLFWWGGQKLLIGSRGGRKSGTRMVVLQRLGVQRGTRVNTK